MKRILVLNFFPAFYPPSSGGEQRYYYLYHHLSYHHDVTLLSATYPNLKEELVEFSRSFRERRIPREDTHVRLHEQLDREKVGPEVSALVCALAAKREDGFRRAFRELAKEADIVIHECPHLVDYDESLGLDRKPRIYNSYNLEYLLARDTFNREAGDNYAAHIHGLERRLVHASERVFVTCGAEELAFREWYGCPPDKLFIVPNGFEPNPSSGRGSRPSGVPESAPFVVFLGSAHPPNVHSAEFILDHLVPLFPDVNFAFAGTVCKALRSDRANVLLLGKVTDEAKDWLLEHCDAALNPIFTGAGTNLKIVDYMAHGSPVITTPFGVRGIDAADGQHCYIRPLSGFVDALRVVLNDSKRSRAIGETAKQHVFKNYNWSAIAERAAGQLSMLGRRSPRKRKDKPKVLVVNDFAVDNPQGGGQVRIFNLYRSLASDFEITLLCFGRNGKRRVTVLAPNLRQVCWPKTPLHAETETAVNRQSDTSAEDILALLYCFDNRDLVAEFRNLAQEADIVVFCHPYLAPLERHAPKRAIRVYEALNHEGSLKRALLAQHPLREELLDAVEAAESHLLTCADQIVCVSDEDAQRFAASASTKAIEVIRNGVTIAERPEAAFGTSIRALFIGSAHPPNVEAVHFIVDELAPSLPDVEFVVVGSVCSAVDQRRTPTNVAFRGFVRDDEKRTLLANAVLGLNPMFSGGGSNLKLADYFAAGVPVVSTPFGARGFDVIDGVHLQLSERKEFAIAVRRLISDPEARSRIGRAAREFAIRHLSWDVLAEQYASRLRELIAARSEKRSKSLLFVTYRYNTVAAGGAEVYLANLASHIGQLGNFDIDVATCDVELIENRDHFSATYTPSKELPSIPDFARNLFIFPVAMPPPDEIRAGAARLFRVWAQESLDQARSLARFYRSTLLMGGWHMPEKDSAGRAVRWTSRRSEIFCGPGTTAVELTGTSPSRKEVLVNFNEQPVGVFSVSGQFRLKVSLPESDGGVLQLTCDANQPGRDLRELGLYVQSLCETSRAAVKQVSLSDDYEAVVRHHAPSEWVHSLIQIADARNLELDDIFCRIRGPHSPLLEEFLHNRCHEYDVVLVQGVPFSITPEAVRCIKESDVPVVLLPHFHMEDRYYHWNCFYKAFRAADIVLGAPDDVKPFFFDRLGANCEIVPGGGIEPVEFEHLDMCKRSFQSLYRDDLPYILILGRKAGAKRYAMAIDAVDRVRHAGVELNVVMIGADEDGIEIRKSFVRNLGRRHRGVVLGALASSICLVNMSESESFGIVLLESWMCGRPVVAAKTCSAFASLVDDGKDGILCATETELVDAIMRLAKDASLAADMGHVGRNKALRTFTWAALSAKVNSLLVALTDRRFSEQSAEDRRAATI